MNAHTLVTLKSGEGRTIRSGGFFIYDNEIESILGRFRNGDIVSVQDHDGWPLGQGYINQNSKIRIRLLTHDIHQTIDDDFWRARLRRAWEYRKKAVPVDSCRIVFGEADFLPGLVIDKYEDVLVLQAQTLGMDRLKEHLAELMTEILSDEGIRIRGVFSRCDGKEREKEGLPREKGFIGNPFDTRVLITEGDIRLIVDVCDGQKTGYFLDQRVNRTVMQRVCGGARVLDCFTHTGSFALHAAAGGAREVLGVDSSETAVSTARENALLNGMDEVVSFCCKDVFSLLPNLLAQGEKYDVVILDPPAFTKAKSSLKSAVRAYRRINAQGMRLLHDGGFLAACSCSHFMDAQTFLQTIEAAARDAHKLLRMVYFGTQAPDHPVILSAGESYYLKFYLFQVWDDEFVPER